MFDTNLISVLCEGTHDTAFLEKILKANSFKSIDSLKLNQYPEPYNQLLINEAKKSNIEGLNIQELRNILLPSSTLKKGNNYVFLYALGGDSKKEKRLSLIKELLEFIPTEPDEYETIPKTTKLTILYVFDADDIGTTKRIQLVNDEVETLIKKENLENPSNLYGGKLTIGTYVFSKEGEDKGKLEDILLPLMKENNDLIFEGSYSFIEEHYDSKRVKKNNFEKQKSAICIAGQLQKSGSSNVIAIKQTDYLSKDKILANKSCIEISTFFNNISIP